MLAQLSHPRLTPQSLALLWETPPFPVYSSVFPPRLWFTEGQASTGDRIERSTCGGGEQLSQGGSVSVWGPPADPPASWMPSFGSWGCSRLRALLCLFARCSVWGCSESRAGRPRAAEVPAAAGGSVRSLLPPGVRPPFLLRAQRPPRCAARTDRRGLGAGLCGSDRCRGGMGAGQVLIGRPSQRLRARAGSSSAGAIADARALNRKRPEAPSPLGAPPTTHPCPWGRS